MANRNGGHRARSGRNGWRPAFLAALAETSNVSKAAESARIEASKAYRLRREDDAFARAWHDALLEGYEHLEMEVLQRLRTGVEPASETTKFDNSNALRLLSLHKQTIERLRAERSRRSEIDVLAEINARIDRMRVAEERGKTETDDSE